MKKSVQWVCLATLLCLCLPSASYGANMAVPTSEQVETDGVKLVKEFLTLLVREYTEGEGATSPERKALLSKEYFASRCIDPEPLILNDLLINDFKILKTTAQYVDTMVFNRNRGWGQSMRLKLIEENGTLRIVPSRATCKKGKGYIDTWWARGKQIITDAQKWENVTRELDELLEKGKKR